ncbi:hypothetical protein CRUP_004650 [Coryphaenoides rupestris]|nr:hypothetical protein CRUP_004650 [Coryphaenoides rupestris]
MESAAKSVEFKWKPPKDDGGCPVTSYTLERQQVGRNKWARLGDVPGGTPSYRDSDVDPGRRYCYPGTPSAPKVVSAFKDCIDLTWSAPCDSGGSDIVGYNLEKHKKGSNYWSIVNQGGPIKGTKYAVKDVFEGAAYEFRVSAVNLSGAGDPSLPCDTVFARDPMKRPAKVIDLKLTSSNYSTFSLAWTKPKEVKGVEDEAQGYYVEIRLIENLEWTRCNANQITLTSFTVLGLKAMAAYWVRVIATNYGGDGEPEGFDSYIIAMPPPDVGSQFLIPMSERSDTGVYTIMLKNMVGQETFNVEIRVTDDPKPPGPVELEQNVPGTVTLCWLPSPDEKRDDRLNYVVAKKDSFKGSWRTVAENLFNHRCTVTNILPGREYNFRVFARNDMGLSKPTPESKGFDFRASPSFIVPLRQRTAPRGYECHMSCAARGDPAPHVTWYRNDVCLNTDTNYHVTRER